MADAIAVRSAFLAAGEGKLTVSSFAMTPESAGFRLIITGFHADGTPFFLQPPPFDADPVQRVYLLARDLIQTHTGVPMPAPVAIRGLAATLREQLTAATDAAGVLAEQAKTEVANLNSVIAQGKEVVADVKAATAEVQAALGLNTNGGDPL